MLSIILVPAAMSRYEEGLSKNQKRRVRLHDRLALAAQDAASRTGEPPARTTTLAGRGQGSEGSKAELQKPTKAPCLEDTISISDGEEQIAGGIATPPKGAGRGERRAWSARGRGSRPQQLCLRTAQEVKRDASAMSSTERWLELPAAQRARIKKEGKSEPAPPTAGFGFEEIPPWRTGAEGKVLRDCRRIVPRWQVEKALQAADQQTLDPVLVSKVGTQLLRWGGSDLQKSDGSMVSLTLVDWQPQHWFPLANLAAELDVDVAYLEEVLPSLGRHGPRVEIADGMARAVWHE